MLTGVYPVASFFQMFIIQVDDLCPKWRNLNHTTLVLRIGAQRVRRMMPRIITSLARALQLPAPALT